MKQRIVAVDALRGLTMATMLLVNQPGSWTYVYAPLRHAHWHGCTLADLVFPFFLFVIGLSMALSLDTLRISLSRSALWWKIGTRTLTLFVLGLLLNAYPWIRQNWDWSHFRILGVLQRIALAYGGAALIGLSLRGWRLGMACAGILLGYWGILLSGSLRGPGLGWVTQIDAWVLGSTHLWRGMKVPFDPEGLVSTLPAIVTVLLGWMLGRQIWGPRQASTEELTSQKAGANSASWSWSHFWLGCLTLLCVGWLWGLVLPWNKKLWTGSYVLWTAGLASVSLGCALWLEARTWGRVLLWPFVVLGSNALFVFLASILWIKTAFRLRYVWQGKTISGYAYLYESAFRPWAGNELGSLFYALAHVLLWWAVALFLYRRRIWIKL